MNIVVLDAAAFLRIQPTLKRMNIHSMEIQQCNQELQNDLTETQKSYALQLNDFIQEKEMLALQVSEAELRNTQLENHMQKLKEENYKWKEELKKSALLLDIQNQKNTEEKNTEENQSLIEELRKETLLQSQEMNRMQTDLDHNKLGLCLPKVYMYTCYVVKKLVLTKIIF